MASETEKTRKLLYLPLAYHAAILLALTILFLSKPETGAYALLIFLDLAGVLVSPMFMALMGISHAILHDGKVYDYTRCSVIYLIIIALMRMAFYAWQYIDSLAMTAILGVASVCIYILWTAIFSFTDKLMKQKTKPWHKKANGKGKKK